MNDKDKERLKNNFVHCICGVTYISGYTHCPKCGVKNPMDEERSRPSGECVVPKNLKI